MSSSVSSTPSLPYTSFQCRLLLSTRRAPQGDRLGVALLQQHDACPGPVGEVGVGVELGRSPPCRTSSRSAIASGLARVPAPTLDEVLDQHAERPAPVTDVVLAHDLVAEQRRACARWRHRSPWCGGGRCASPWRRWAPSSRRRRAAVSRAGDARGARRRRCRRASCPRNAVVDREVEEARAGDLDRGHAGEVGGGEHLGGDLARVAPEPPWRGPARRWPGRRRDRTARTTGSTAATAASSSPRLGRRRTPGARRSARRASRSAMVVPLWRLAAPMPPVGIARPARFCGTFGTAAVHNAPQIPAAASLRARTPS